MPGNLIQQASNHLPRRFAESPNDIFLLTKTYVSDTSLCQEPLLVWPGAEAQACSDTLRRIARNQVPGSLNGK